MDIFPSDDEGPSAAPGRVVVVDAATDCLGDEIDDGGAAGSASPRRAAVGATNLVDMYSTTAM